jgi:hypothetical protein
MVPVSVIFCTAAQHIKARGALGVAVYRTGGELLGREVCQGGGNGRFTHPSFVIIDSYWIKVSHGDMIILQPTRPLSISLKLDI